MSVLFSSMKKIIFICHGNICRSPVGEILFNTEIKKLGLENEYQAISRATSREEIGNNIYPPMRDVLKKNNVEFSRHYATQISKKEFDEADYIFYMDLNNLYYLERMFGPSKKFVLVSFYLDGIPIEDPWYTDRFDFVFKRISDSVDKIIDYLISK